MRRTWEASARIMSNAKRKELKDTGRGAVGKVAVVGAKERNSKKVRAKVLDRTDRTDRTDSATLQGFVLESVDEDATVYTDEHRGYLGLPRKHEAVKHVCQSMYAIRHTRTA